MNSLILHLYEVLITQFLKDTINVGNSQAECIRSNFLCKGKPEHSAVRKAELLKTDIRSLPVILGRGSGVSERLEQRKSAGVPREGCVKPAIDGAQF